MYPWNIIKIRDLCSKYYYVFGLLLEILADKIYIYIVFLSFSARNLSICFSFLVHMYIDKTSVLISNLYILL